MNRLLFILGILLSSWSYAYVWELPPALIVDEKQEDRIIPDSLYEFYIDSSKTLGFDDVKKLSFQKGNKLINSQNINYWIRIPVQGNPENHKKFVFEIYNVHIDSLTFYAPLNDSTYSESKTGYKKLFDQREYKTINFVFDVDGANPNIQYYYLKIWSKDPQWLETHLRTTNFYVYYAVTEYYLLGLFYGIILIMAVYNFLIFFSTREKVYIYYVIYVLTGGLMTLIEDGTGFAYLWPNSPDFSNYVSNYPRLLWMISFVLYSTTFLKTRVYYPQWGKYINYSVLAYVGAFLLEKFFGVSFFNYQLYLLPLLIIYGLSYLVWLKKGYTPARYFVYGFSAVIVSIVISFFRDKGFALDGGNQKLGVLIVYSVNIAFVIEILFLSIALGNRIKFLKESRERAQARIIGQLKENEQLKDKVNRELEQKVQERTSELNKKNKDIIDSINYAQRIQSSVLPSPEDVQKMIPNSAVFYRPKDIVSGDFLWVNETKHFKYFAVVDCTGHGVPGALMSIMANNNLNAILRDSEPTPGELLEQLDTRVKNLIKVSEDDFENYGMDISVVAIEKQTNRGFYAGAFNPLWIINKNELTELSANRYPVGHYFFNPENKAFDTHEFELKKGSKLYLFSDGFQDQFGGPNGDKFMKESFKKLLTESSDLALVEQSQLLEDTFDTWKGKREQIDDVLVLVVEV